RLVASAPIAGFSTSGRLAAAAGVTRPFSGSLALGSRLRSSRQPGESPGTEAGPARFARSVALPRRTGANCRTSNSHGLNLAGSKTKRSYLAQPECTETHGEEPVFSLWYAMHEWRARAERAPHTPALHVTWTNELVL